LKILQIRLEWFKQEKRKGECKAARRIAFFPFYNKGTPAAIRDSINNDFNLRVYV
jgi:hypothetical protein